jgi:hypothetical protein
MLTLPEQVALIYTRAGSQRAVARELGISHQKVGRLLRTANNDPSGDRYAPASRVLTDKTLTRTVARAFDAHKAATKAQAKADGLPYSDKLPVFMRRLPMDDPKRTPGDRADAPHLHWLPDRLRDKWLALTHRSGKFYALSVGSVVNMAAYNRLMNALQRGAFRDPKQARAKREILEQIKSGIAQGLIQTKYTDWRKREIPFPYLLQSVKDKVNEKHAGAVGDPGTSLASRALFQLDTTDNKDASFRAKHPRPIRYTDPETGEIFFEYPEDKPRQARRDKRRGR